MLSFLVKSVRWLYVNLIGQIGRAMLRLAGVEFAEGLLLYGMPIVSRTPNSAISLGKRVVLCSSSRYTALGVNHPVVLRTLSPRAEIVVGDDVGISGGSICSASRVLIGAKTMLGANVTVTDTDFHNLEPHNRRYRGLEGAKTAPVTIGENVFVGAESIILKGVRIGNNTVIGARSVVTSDIPDDVIAAGNPCRVIGPIPGVSSLPAGAPK